LTEFTSYIIYRKEWALKWFIILAILFSFLLVSNWYLKSKFLSILFFALLLGSFLFVKIMMKYFTRKALIRIETDKISFNILNVKDDSEDSFLVFPFDKIKSYVQQT